MANQLIKTKKYIAAIAGQEYRPARAARTGFEQQTVCGYKDATWQPNVHIPDFGSGADYDVEYANFLALWQQENGSRAEVEGGYYDSAGQPVAYSCWTETVKVDVPGDPGQIYIAAVPASVGYNLGWNAGARSLKSIIKNGKATFQAGATNVGAICGLNGFESPLNYTGTTIKFGWYFARGAAKIIEAGSFKTGTYPYTNETVFTVKRSGNVVTYWVDDVLAYTSAAVSTEPLWLQAALYSGDDEIFSPALLMPGAEAVTGTLTLKIPPAALSLTDSSITRLRLRLPPPALKLGLPDGAAVLRLKIPPATFAGRNGNGGVFRIKLAQPGLALNLSGLAAPEFSSFNLVLPSVAPSLYGLVGAVGNLSLSIPPVNVLAFDKQVARMAFDLPLVSFRARNWPLGELPFYNSPLAISGRSGLSGVTKLPAKAMNLVAGGSITHYGEVTLSAVTMTLLVGGEISVQAETSLATLPMVLLAGGKIGALSELNEVFAMNITGDAPGGTTQYTGYEFNSVAKIGGRYYGATDDGLFLLEGDDDNGTPIEATFGFGQLDLGSAQVKTVTYCYLGTAAGGMRLKIDALVNGRPANYTYPARGHGASMRGIRFDLGKGLRSTYVMPTFYNSNGDAFEVDAMRFLVADSARRI